MFLESQFQLIKGKVFVSKTFNLNKDFRYEHVFQVLVFLLQKISKVIAVVAVSTKKRVLYNDIYIATITRSQHKQCSMYLPLSKWQAIYTMCVLLQSGPSRNWFLLPTGGETKQNFYTDNKIVILPKEKKLYEAQTLSARYHNKPCEKRERECAHFSTKGGWILGLSVGILVQCLQECHSFLSTHWVDRFKVTKIEAQSLILNKTHSYLKKWFLIFFCDLNI